MKAGHIYKRKLILVISEKKQTPLEGGRQGNIIIRVHVLMEQIHSGAMMQSIFRLVPGHVPKHVHSGCFGSHPFFNSNSKNYQETEIIADSLKLRPNPSSCANT